MDTTTTTTDQAEPCVDERRELRLLAGTGSTRGEWSRAPVCVVEGAGAPQRRGSDWHYETMGGSLIYHPSAYSRLGWSNMRYVGSTRRVEVGAAWLAAWRLAGGVYRPA